MSQKPPLPGLVRQSSESSQTEVGAGTGEHNTKTEQIRIGSNKETANANESDGVRDVNRSDAGSNGNPGRMPKGRPPMSPLKPGRKDNVEVDEMGTIHLIDSLDPEAKKVLNSLVQSVLVTQQENDKNKLELLAKKRELIQAEKTMMNE